MEWRRQQIVRTVYMVLLGYADALRFNRDGRDWHEYVRRTLRSQLRAPEFSLDEIASFERWSKTKPRCHGCIKRWAKDEMARVLGSDVAATFPSEISPLGTQRHVTLQRVYECLFLYACEVLNAGRNEARWNIRVVDGLRGWIREPELFECEVLAFAKMSRVAFPVSGSPSVWAQKATGALLGHSARWAKREKVKTGHRRWASTQANRRRNHPADYDPFTSFERTFYSLPSPTQQAISESIRLYSDREQAKRASLSEEERNSDEELSIADYLAKSRAWKIENGSKRIPLALKLAIESGIQTARRALAGKMKTNRGVGHVVDRVVIDQKPVSRNRWPMPRDLPRATPEVWPLPPLLDLNSPEGGAN